MEVFDYEEISLLVGGLWLSKEQSQLERASHAVYQLTESCAIKVIVVLPYIIYKISWWISRFVSTLTVSNTGKTLKKCASINISMFKIYLQV